jgi:hypothetical protein
MASIRCDSDLVDRTSIPLERAKALAALEVPDPQRPVTRGRDHATSIRSAREAHCASRTLLVLDGLEPLQNPPGPQEGRLREPSLQALLRELAAFNLLKPRWV